MDQSTKHYILSLYNLGFLNFLVKTKNGPKKAIKLVIEYLNRNPELYLKIIPGNKPLTLKKIENNIVISLIMSEEEDIDYDKLYDISSEGVYAGKIKPNSITNLTKISE